MFMFPVVGLVVLQIGTSLCKGKCVESDVDENVVKESNAKLLSMIGEYSTSNIYKADESELFYNL